MRLSIGHGRENAEERLEEHGISRRSFMKFCTAVAVAMGMGPAFAPEVAKALTSNKRPSVVYLHCAECTGCSEALLRTTQPYLDELIFNVISLDYHETVMAAAGDMAEKALHDAVHNPDGFICIVEGGIPTAMNGAYGKVAGKTMLEICEEIVPKAKAVINMGTCASFGGVQAAKPNPSGTKGVNDALKDHHVKGINIGGCPPNPINLVGTVVALLQGKEVELDDLNRPTMFFGELVHDKCPRLKYFDEGLFAPSFDSEEAKKGYCLYEVGCKGPYTYNNCPTAKFNETNWPVDAGHPCIGCSEPDFWDELSPFYEE